jgi:hypothetical protein
MSFTEVGTVGNVGQANTGDATNSQAQSTSGDAAANVDYPTVVAPPGAGGIGHA